LAISLGWTLSPPTRIHSLAPLTLLNRAGSTTGKNSRPSPAKAAL
jgi:hypothetical protein